MIRTAKLIFCENEHGTGDITFPDMDDSTFDLRQHFILNKRIGALRREAKKAGWGRINGGDYCPSCMEAGV